MKKHSRVSLLATLVVTAAVWSGCSSRPRIVLRIAQQTPDVQQSALLQADAGVIAARMKRLFAEQSPRARKGGPVVTVVQDRITVTNCGGIDSARLRYLLTAPGVLEFHLEAPIETTVSVVRRIDSCLTSTGSTRTGPSVLRELLTSAHGHYAVAESTYPVLREKLSRVDTTMLGGYEVVFGPSETHGDSLIRGLYVLRRVPELSTVDGKLIDTATVRWFTSPVESSLVIDFRLTRKTNSRYNPVARFAEVTERSINRRLAIVLGSVVLSDPAIRARIPDGSCMIMTNDANAQRAHDMANVIASGALAAPLVVEKMEYVSR